MSETDNVTRPTSINTVNVTDFEDGDASAARSVYANNLLMAEIYSWLPEFADRKNRTLLSKSGWEEAARVLFRQGSVRNLLPLHHESSPERTAQILGFVRFTWCRQNEMDIADGVTVFRCSGHSRHCDDCTLVVPLTMFFNLELLNIVDLPRGLPVEEQHMFGDRAIMVQSQVHGEFKQAPMIQVKGSSASSLRCITIPMHDCERIDYIIAEGFVKAAREHLCNAQASEEEVLLFAQLRSFESFVFPEIGLDAISALLQRCPLLTRLAFRLHNLGNLPDILKTAPRLHDVKIEGAALSWLPSLVFIPRLSLSCKLKRDPEILEWIAQDLQPKGDVQTRSQVRYLHLHVTDYFDIGNKYRAVARFILSLVPIDAEIVVTGNGSLPAEIDSVRQEDKIAKMEQREKERTGPGYRLIEKPQI
ncbi:hypothetical protein FFLO_05595 [Filobasidium floriforme]|uniref:Uncharacterized protein n=1 Tax=Filobasidium floriforme TaxID=5210 RepID=A0A8K0JGQ0_9TREE|nr:hypothetical protein FFLO_05595 [Filobasidium floriforme]